MGLSEPTGFFGPYTRNYLNNKFFIDQGTVRLRFCAAMANAIRANLMVIVRQDLRTTALPPD